MATAPKCKTCGQREWGLCPNCAAINRPEERLTDAINTPESAINTVRLEPEADLGEATSRAPSPTPVQRTSNRRSREAYNAYMRDYMKRKRHA